MDNPKMMVDAGAVTTSLASFLGLLPTVLSIIASLLSIVWLTARIMQMLFPRHYRALVIKLDRPTGKYVDGTPVPNTRKGDDDELEP